MSFSIDYFVIWSLLAFIPVIVFPMFVGCGESTLRVTEPVDATPFTISAFVSGELSLVDILDRHQNNALATSEELDAISTLQNTLKIGVVDPGIQPTDFEIAHTISVTSLSADLVSDTASQTVLLQLVPQFFDEVVVEDWTTNSVIQFPGVPVRTVSGWPDNDRYSLRVSVNSDLLLNQQSVRIPFLTGSAVFIATRTDGAELAADFSIVAPDVATTDANVSAINQTLRELNA